MHGAVEGIFIAEFQSPTFSVGSVLAVTGRGLDGDRYLAPADGWAPRGMAISLIEAEVIEAVREQHGIDLANGRSRRQVVTRGVRLNDLVGVEFTVGEARCRGFELCEPCLSLSELIGEPGLIKALAHRGGLRADILAGGRIAVGDGIAPRAVPPSRR
jgi:MOSC domain-containing protein YiiM